MKSWSDIVQFLFSDNIYINLHRCGWADSLTGDQKIIFALQLALFKAGKGLGYKIQYVKKPVKDSAVYNPYAFDVVASTVTSVGYTNLGKITEERHETWEHIKFKFIAKSYSVRSIYEGAIKAL
jgi:hypothetical protein